MQPCSFFCDPSLSRSVTCVLLMEPKVVLGDLWHQLALHNIDSSERELFPFDFILIDS